MKIQILETKQVLSSIDVDLPHYFKMDLTNVDTLDDEDDDEFDEFDDDGKEHIVYGVVKNDGIFRVTEITDSDQTNVVYLLENFEWDAMKPNFPADMHYVFDKELKTTKQEYEEARERAFEYLRRF